MPGVSVLRVTMEMRGAPGMQSVLSESHVMAQAEWSGPMTIEIPTGVVKQGLVLFSAGGLSTVSAVMLTSDQPVSITYGVAGNNDPIDLDAGGIHAMSGTNVAAMAVSNNSGVTANLTILVAGP